MNEEPTNQAVMVRAGQLFFISREEYSDYYIQGHFIALEDLSQEVFDYAVSNIKARIDAGAIYDFYDALEEVLPGELIRSGKIMAIECTEIHTGAYGNFDLSARSLGWENREVTE
jgi:hypothetical protein